MGGLCSEYPFVLEAAAGGKTGVLKIVRRIILSEVNIQHREHNRKASQNCLSWTVTLGSEPQTALWRARVCVCYTAGKRVCGASARACVSVSVIFCFVGRLGGLETGRGLHTLSHGAQKAFEPVRALGLRLRACGSEAQHKRWRGSGFHTLEAARSVSCVVIHEAHENVG